MTSGTDSETLVKLISILEGHGRSVTEEQQRDLLAAIEQAKDGNGKAAKSLLEKSVALHGTQHNQ